MNKTGTVKIPAEKNASGKDRYISNIDLDEDFAGFDELSIISFGKNVNQNLDMHRWLFDVNPYNPEDKNLMFVLKEEGKIIASDGLIPFNLYVNGKTVRGAHSVKSMTHPDFKRQGIFRTMTQNSLDQGKENGVDLVIGLANKNSYPAYENFGWPTLFEKWIFVRPVRITKKLKSMLKIGFLATVGNGVYMAYDSLRTKLKSDPLKALDAKVVEYEQVPEKAEECWENNKAKYEVCIERTFKYLNYRYNQRPDLNYKTLLIEKNGEKSTVLGVVVLRESSVGGYKIVSVAENFTDPTDELCIGAVAKAIVDYTKKCGAIYCVVGTGLYGKYKEVLPKYGFMKNSRRLTNNMMVAWPLSDRITIEELNGHDKWHISQGDGETELDL